MEQKNVIAWEVKKEDREYRFLLPAHAPLGEAYEVAREYLAKVVELINNHVAEPKAEEDPDMDSSEEPASEEQE